MPLKKIVRLFSTRDKVLLGFIFAVTCLIFSSVFSYVISIHLVNNAKWVAHTLEVQKALAIIEKEVMQAESNVRGYHLYKDDPSFLHPSIEEKSKLIDTEYNYLNSLTKDNATEQANLDTLQYYLREKMQILKGSLSRNYQQVLNAPNARGPAVTDSVTDKIDDMNAIEAQLLSQRTSRFDLLSNMLVFPLLIISLIAIFIAFYSYFLLNKNVTTINDTNKQLSVYQEKLQNNIDLLNKSNVELEQFAYVASHDLQEPLRKVLTFGDRLQLKYASELDGEGMELINRMKAACERMRVLINDLLNFSRMSRVSKTAYVKVNLQTILKEVLNDLDETIREKNAVIKIDNPLPVIEGIEVQLRQLFQNIISNSLKYSSAERKPEIDIDYSEIDANKLSTEFELVLPGKYCRIKIKDNGIGFSNKYAERIFLIFQRLHGRNEYEGTGIGLAICKKIAENHNGFITADGKNDAGATFVITLPYQHF